MKAKAAPVAALAATVIALAWPFLSQPYHIDEPMFVATAKHALQDPRHPMSFDFNWYGRVASMKEINNNPPLSAYLFAMCFKLSGGDEWLSRVLLLPLDLVAALALYGLASRFLRRPFWPTFVIVASPAYAINMAHLMAEKPLAALAFPALYACLRGVDSENDWWYGLSAVLFSLALLTKYAGLFLLVPAVVYALSRGIPGRKVAVHAFSSCALLGVYLIAASTREGQGGFAAVIHVFSQTAQESFALPLSRVRALLAFIGGCGLVPAAWSLSTMRLRAWKIPCCVGAITILFLPFWDTTPPAWPARIMAVLFSCAALGALAGVFTSRRPFWISWAASGALLALCYWSVVTRTVMFLLPPLTFAAAQRLESLWGEHRLTRFYAASGAAIALLTLLLSAVDYRYASAQKEIAQIVSRSAAEKKQQVWCGSHWGLQHYLVAAGARQLDWTRGGWDEVQPGDIVVISRVNSSVLFPETKLLAYVRNVRADSAIPLRLTSGWGGQAGFYSNMNGFLPYAFSREPLDEFLIAEMR